MQPPATTGGAKRPLLSIVTPAYNEELNLVHLYKGLVDQLESLAIAWEWIIVDDHSADRTFDAGAALAARDTRVRVFRLSRNRGSHVALVCGLNLALGECAVVMAADMQDPPETIPMLLEKWRAGAQVVWAVREKREGETASTVGFARLYYAMMRQFVGIKDMPAEGADFFLLDTRVLRALREFGEANVSLMALLTWMGFRQDRIYYVKQARLHGTSGWNVRRKIKLVIDSVTAFTYRPLRLMSMVGLVVAIAGFLYALVVIVNRLAGNAPQGWSALMVVLLVLGGIQMIMMGVLGEYLWRALDEARRRPRYLIEREVDAVQNNQEGDAG